MSNVPPLRDHNDSSEQSNREPVRVVLTGSRAGITSTIHLLYSKGFGHPNLWSPLLRTPSGDQFYSVFTRWINRGRDSKETSKE